MPKKYKIAIIISVLALVVLMVMVVFELFKTRSNNESRSSPGSQVIQLTEAEKEILKDKAVDFLRFYNSYFYGQYNSALNAAEDGTIEFQRRALLRSADLEEQTPEGYAIDTHPVPSTILLEEKSDGSVEITIKADIEEIKDGITKNYNRSFILTYVREAGGWKVSNIRE